MGIKLQIEEISTGTIVEHFLKPNKQQRVLAVHHDESMGTDFAGRSWGYHFYFQFLSWANLLKEGDEVEFKINGLPQHSSDTYHCEILRILNEKRYEVPEWLKKDCLAYWYDCGLYIFKVLNVNHYSGKVLLQNSTLGPQSDKMTFDINDLHKTAQDAETAYRLLEA